MELRSGWAVDEARAVDVVEELGILEALCSTVLDLSPAKSVWVRVEAELIVGWTAGGVLGTVDLRSDVGLLAAAGCVCVVCCVVLA